MKNDCPDNIPLSGPRLSVGQLVTQCMCVSKHCRFCRPSGWSDRNGEAPFDAAFRRKYDGAGRRWNKYIHVDQTRDLGIVIDSKLTFAQHVDHVVKRAN